MELDIDIWRNILINLDEKRIFGLITSCKMFEMATRSELFWKNYYDVRGYISDFGKSETTEFRDIGRLMTIKPTKENGELYQYILSHNKFFQYKFFHHNDICSTEDIAYMMIIYLEDVYVTFFTLNLEYTIMNISFVILKVELGWLAFI